MEITVLFERGLVGDVPPAEWLKSVAEKALNHERGTGSAELSIVIAGARKLRELNRKYLEEDGPTDVLSFPMLPPGEDGSGFVAPPDGVTHLGEVVISLPQAAEQALERGHSVRREVAVLTIHGILHLLGYDHDGREAEDAMRQREEEIMGMIDTL